MNCFVDFFVSDAKTYLSVLRWTPGAQKELPKKREQRENVVFYMDSHRTSSLDYPKNIPGVTPNDTLVAAW